MPASKLWVKSRETHKRRPEADHETRFLISSRISKRRDLADVRATFQDAKAKMSKRPLAIVHDGLQSYNDGFNREFYTQAGPRIENIRSVGQRDEGLTGWWKG